MFVGFHFRFKLSLMSNCSSRKHGFRFHFSVIQPGDTVAAIRETAIHGETAVQGKSAVQRKTAVHGETAVHGDTAVHGETAPCHHVGIYLGNGDIIDFTNELRKVTLTVFTDGVQSLAQVRYTGSQEPYSPEVIMTKAKDALKNPALVGSYDVSSNNSEHFVTHCTFGKRLSFETETGVLVDVKEWLSSKLPSPPSWREFAGALFPAPGRNMETSHPVTCSVKLVKIEDRR